MGTLKTEMLQDGCFIDAADARIELFSYIDSNYNTHRRHSSLGYKTPAEFEAQITPLTKYKLVQKSLACQEITATEMGPMAGSMATSYAAGGNPQIPSIEYPSPLSHRIPRRDDSDVVEHPDTA